MSADPFTEAARRDMDPGPTGQNNRAWFVAGAEWQAAQEPTDAEVKAAAIECVKFLFLTAPERPWEDPEVVEQWEPMARIALRSARAARRDEENR